MPPLWRRAFDRAESAAAPLLEQATTSDRFVDVMAAGARVRRALASETEKASRRWLHLWNLPAAGDMVALRRQLAGLEREVRHLRRQLDGRAPGSAGTARGTPALPNVAAEGEHPVTAGDTIG